MPEKRFFQSLQIYYKKQTHKVIKQYFFQGGFSRIMLRKQQYIQGISSNVRETDCK